MNTHGLPNDVLSNLDPFALLSASRSLSLVSPPPLGPSSRLRIIFSLKTAFRTLFSHPRRACAPASRSRASC